MGKLILLDSLLQEIYTMKGFNQLIVASMLVAGSLALTREKRADCAAEFQAYSTCTQQAAASISQINPTDASQIPKAGCNMIESILSCNNKIDANCKTPQFDGMMKQSVDGFLQTLSGMPGWEADKCPALKNYMNGGSSGASEKCASVALLVFLLGRFFM